MHVGLGARSLVTGHAMPVGIVSGPEKCPRCKTQGFSNFEVNPRDGVAFWTCYKCGEVLHYDLIHPSVVSAGEGC